MPRLATLTSVPARACAAARAATLRVLPEPPAPTTAIAPCACGRRTGAGSDAAIIALTSSVSVPSALNGPRREIAAPTRPAARAGVSPEATSRR